MVRRISHAFFRLVVALTALAIIAMAGLGARLAAGPIQLTWLAPSLERALTPADRRVRVEVRDAQLRLGDDRALELVGIDVQVKAPDGEVLLELPETEVGISLRALLAHRRLAATSLEATAPRLVLARTEDGLGLRGVTAEGQEPRGRIEIDALVAALLSVDPNEPLSYLDRFEISGGQLILEDRVTDHTIMARDGALSFGRWPGGLVAELAFELQQTGEPARIRATGRLKAATNRISFTLAFEQLSAGELPRIEPLLPLHGVDVSLAGRLAGEVDLEGTLSPITFEVQATNGVIDRPDLLAGRLPIDSARVTGRIAADLEAITLTQARLATNGAAIEGTAEIAWRNRDLSLRAEITAANVAAQDLELYWPPELGREARAWVVANITEGVVPRAEAIIAFQPGDLEARPIPETTVAGRFEFDDLTLRYFETMPPLTGVGGTATFTARRMDFAVARGHAGDLVVQDGNVAITGIGIKGRYTTQLEVLAHVAGPIEQAMALLDHPPLGFAGELGIVPASASGRVRTELRIGTPLNRDMDPAEVRIAASAELTDAGIAGLRGAVDLSEGRFSLKVDREGADLAGEASINQVPLAIEWRENFADEAPFERRFHLRGTLSADAPRQLGLALPLPARGSFGLDATVLESADGRTAELALDLHDLALEAPEIDWRKPAGAAGRLTAALSLPEGGAVRIDTFELSSAGLEAAGSLALTTAPLRIEHLALQRFRAGIGEGALELQAREQGYRISVRAHTLDLGALEQARAAADDAAADAPPTPLTVHLAADQVALGEHGVSDVDAHLVRDPQGWRTAELHGRLPEGGEVSLTLAEVDGSRRLRITSDAAGALLQTLHQTTEIEGGKLELKADVLQQVPRLALEGTLRIERFKLLDAPLLARLLTLASLTGIGNLLGGEGIYFDRLELPFTLQGDLLSIDRGRMSGSQLGLTVRGPVDLERDRLDLQGTVVPLYALNRAIGKIPLVGPFLTGREGEGAFAATYSVKGPLEAPQISVNPLSVLAPGFLRDLFSGIASGSLEPPVIPNPDD